jgi:hypothetical protein
MSSFKGAQSWWGGRLACLADSLATYVMVICTDSCSTITSAWHVGSQNILQNAVCPCDLSKGICINQDKLTPICIIP